MSHWTEWFRYDETSPSCLVRVKAWVIPIGDTGLEYIREAAGANAGGLTVKGYWTVWNGQQNKGHRVVWELHNGPIPEGMCIDHIDGNRANNKIANLRVATSSQNQRNKAMQGNNTSGKTGVNKITNMGIDYWCAVWTGHNGKLMKKSFNIAKFGDEEAKRLASEYRDEMIEKLNADGAGYTARHGINYKEDGNEAGKEV